MGRGGGEGVNDSCVRSATECTKVTSSVRVPGQCEEQILQPGDTEATELCQGTNWHGTHTRKIMLL